jgi:uncharacterized protein (DUF488 family)
MTVRPALFTIGHSNHAFEHFRDLLIGHRVEVVADVRSWPASRYTPWFDRANLTGELRAAGVGYVFLGRELGGRPEDQSQYDADGHVLYDEVASSDLFGNGLDRLVTGIETRRVAIMCAEEDPEHCHRRLLVARVLFENGIEVQHIRGDGRLETEQGFAETNPTLFSDGELPWRSTRSVSPRQPPSTSSAA